MLATQRREQVRGRGTLVHRHLRGHVTAVGKKQFQAVQRARGDAGAGAAQQLQGIGENLCCCVHLFYSLFVSYQEIQA